MSKYNCDLCEFHTNRKTEYTRHLSTKKHLEKIESRSTESILNPIKIQHESNNKFVCMHCQNTYSSQSNLSKHMKKCANKVIKEKDDCMKDKEIERLQKQVETYENMLKSFTTPQTINYFNYICTNYPGAPALKSQKSHVNMIENTMELIDVVTMYYYDDKLISFIGDYVIGLYKKEKPQNQSIWSTDVSRLTYIISECCIKTKENIWSYDKKACKTKELAIAPALKFLRDNLVEFCQENGGNSESHVLKQLIAANGTIQMIDNGELAMGIAKYIAPKFAISQGDSKLLMNV